jgi:hypothetical protein
MLDVAREHAGLHPLEAQACSTATIVPLENLQVFERMGVMFLL